MDLERHEMSAEKCSTEHLWGGRTSTNHASGSSQAVLAIRLLPASCRASPCVPHFSLRGTSVTWKNADKHDSSHWLPVLTSRPLCMHCSIPLCVSLHGFTSFVALDASDRPKQYNAHYSKWWVSCACRSHGSHRTDAFTAKHRSISAFASRSVTTLPVEEIIPNSRAG